MSNPAPGQQFRNAASEREREEVLRNDTLQFRTAADLGLGNSGRFAKPHTIVGETPAPQYPTGPNWSVDPTGPEPPLGIDVNAIEACGEVWEIEQSLSAHLAGQGGKGDEANQPTEFGATSASSPTTNERTAPEASLSHDAKPVRGAEVGSERPSLKSPQPTFPRRRP